MAFEVTRMSHPSRVRGLKYDQKYNQLSLAAVAPFAGAWIEICTWPIRMSDDSVAPFAGAWIEISDGLYYFRKETVAPFAGAWIEIR